MTANDLDDFVEFDDDKTLGAAVAVAFRHDLDLTQDHHQKTINQQLFQNPQSAHSIIAPIDLGADESPDLSVREADSVSAKHAGCTAALTNGYVRMMDAAHDQRKNEWVLSFTQYDTDATFLFDTNMASSGVDSQFLTDDNLFGFDAVSLGNSLEDVNGIIENSLAMPASQAARVQKTIALSKSKPKAEAQRKNKAAAKTVSATARIRKTWEIRMNSAAIQSRVQGVPNCQIESLTCVEVLLTPCQYPSANHKINVMRISGSREVSPMSQGMTSHQASPSAFFSHSPSLVTESDVAAQASNSSMRMGNHRPNGSPAMVSMSAQYSVCSPLVTQESFHYFTNHHQNNTKFTSMLSACKLVVHATPPRSRVETQIPIRMTLTGAPPGIKRLHFPTHTVSTPKLLLKEPVEPAPDMLELYIQLVCTTAMQSDANKQRALTRARTAPHPRIGSEEELQKDPSDLAPENQPQNGGEVRICYRCITRERKRANRRSVKRWEKEEAWKRDEFRRVVVFNIGEVREWNSPAVDDPTLPRDFQVPAGSLQVDAKMRISCYCRHHQEKIGFQVIFTMKNFQGDMVAQAMSPSIMITDDHKVQPAPPGSTAEMVPQGSNAHLVQGEGDRSIMSLGESSVHPAPPASSGTPRSSMNLQPLPRAQPTPNKHPVSVSGSSPAATSRTTSPSLNMGPATKKWKTFGSTVPRDMTMTRLDTSSSTQMPPPPLHAPVSSAVSLYSQIPQKYQSPEAAYGSGPGAVNLQRAFLNASMDNSSMAVFSAPISAHPGRAPTPNALSPIGPPPSLAQACSAQLPTMAAAPTQPLQNQSPPPPPCIHKIIPGEGLKMGGIEVTILGSNFTQELVVYFGDAKATTTTYWGDSSLVCLLPSRFGPGVVPVTLRHMHSAHLPFTLHLNHFFRYLDDEERQMTRMMLGIISQKMMGELLDVKELAVKVLGTTDTDWSALASP